MLDDHKHLRWILDRNPESTIKYLFSMAKRSKTSPPFGDEDAVVVMMRWLCMGQMGYCGPGLLLISTFKMYT